MPRRQPGPETLPRRAWLDGGCRGLLATAVAGMLADESASAVTTNYCNTAVVALVLALTM